jgi:DNA polymerase-3 subunit gamma/tau
MAARSLSFDTALQEMASLFTRLQIAQLAPQAIADDLPERSRLLDLATRLNPEFIQLAYQIALHGRQELPLAPDEQAGFVMTLLRLHAFRPLFADDAGAGSTPAAAVARRQPSPPARNSAVSPPAIAPAPAAPATDRAAASPVAAPQPPDAAEPVRPAIDDWHEILAALKVSGMARELAQHCELCDREAGRIVLRLSPTHRHLLMKPAQEKLQQALSEHFNRPLQLAIELAEGLGDTPAAAAQRDRRERMDRAVASVEQDGFVREVIEMFDATLIESSIKPI